MSRLDRSRPYGQVYGAGHAFEQDGKQFDQEGEEIGAGKTTPAPKPGKSSKAAPADDDQVSAQLNS